MTDKIELDIIELNKVNNEYNKDKGNKKAQWMMFINNPEGKEVSKIMEENEGIKEAVVTVRKMSKYEKLRKLAELREKAIMDERACYYTGLHQGEKIGEEKRGKEAAKIEIAKKLIKMGMTIEEICKATEMTDEEIKSIMQNI